MLLIRRSSPSAVVVAEASALAAHSSACTEASSLFCGFKCRIGRERGGRDIAEGVIAKGVSDGETRFEYVTNGGGAYDSEAFRGIIGAFAWCSVFTVANSKTCQHVTSAFGRTSQPRASISGTELHSCPKGKIEVNDRLTTGGTHRVILSEMPARFSSARINSLASSLLRPPPPRPGGAAPRRSLPLPYRTAPTAPSE